MKAIWTILIGGYVLAAELLMPQIYNIWAILVVEALTLILWLVGFALLASIAATLDDCLDKIDKAYATGRYRDALSAYSKCTSVKDFVDAARSHDMREGRREQRCLAAGAGVGAICL